jgi:hypothetical protein
MPEDKKPKKKPEGKSRPSSEKKPPTAGGPPAGGPPPGMDPMATGVGTAPPMPGQGIDPYAALAGQISQTPPMGQPGLGAGGVGLGMTPGGMGGGEPLLGGPPTDPIMHALSGSASPMSFPPDIAEHAVDPPPDQIQQQMSLQQLLELLSMMQAGIPNSGLTPPSRPGSVATGMLPMNAGGML